MGDKRLYFDEDEQKQYYVDENGNRVYVEPEGGKRDNSVKVTIIGGIFALIVAVIGIIPLFPRETAMGETEFVAPVCVLLNSQFINSVFNCGSQDSDIEIAVAATLTAVAQTPSSATEIPTIAPIPPTATTVPPTTVPQPTANISSQRTLVDTIEVPASSEIPVSFSCPSDGTYELVLEEGAYSPWQNGVGGQWRTMVYAYVNNDVLWERNQFSFIAPAPVGTPSQDMAAVGRMEMQNNDTQANAASLGRGDADRIYCQAGQPVNFITMDERGSYSDNFGSITIGIYSLGE